MRGLAERAERRDERADVRAWSFSKKPIVREVCSAEQRGVGLRGRMKARASWIWRRWRVGGGDRERVAAGAAMMQRACRTGWEDVVGMQGAGGERGGGWQVGRLAGRSRVKQVSV